MSDVRRATVADVSEIVPMVRAYWELEGIEGFTPDRVAVGLERLLSDERLGAGWIASIDGLPAGYLLLVHVFSLEHLGLTAEIDELFVDGVHRGRGIGAMLLAAAEREASRAGCTNISLQVSRGNEGARAFYRRHGYVARDGYGLLEKTL